MLEIEAPTQAQKEHSAASRLAGQMKPGQSESHHRNLLLLEGIEPERIGAVFLEAQKLHQLQLKRNQTPLKLRANLQICLGILSFIIAVCCLFIFPQVISGVSSGQLWMWGLMLLLASFGWVSLRQGFKLRAELRREQGSKTTSN